MNIQLNIYNCTYKKAKMKYNKSFNKLESFYLRYFGTLEIFFLFLNSLDYGN